MTRTAGPPVRTGRGPLDPRPLTVRRGVNAHAEGSAWLELGRTQILSTVTVENKVPPHQRGKKTGWLMAEYNLLPRATHERLPRERALQNGRRQEIQRLLGRAFRTAVDLAPFRDKTLIIDCDVIQADGSTRVASVLAGYAALWDFADRLVRAGTISEWPLRHELGAVSVGLIGGELRLDLDYAEDMRAAADLNVVATAEGHIIEAQGGAEDEPLSPERYGELLTAGLDGVRRLLTELHRQLK